jgi:hypothetical protein
MLFVDERERIVLGTKFRGDGAVPSDFFPLNILPHTRWNTGREASEREDEFTSLYRSELKEMAV